MRNISISKKKCIRHKICLRIGGILVANKIQTSTTYTSYTESMMAIKITYASPLVKRALLTFGLLVAAAAQAEVVYSNIPSVLAGNYPSLGYEATSTSELGDHIAFGPGARKLNTVTVTMSNWALASQYSSNATGYQHDLTFNLYNYAGDTAAGSLLATNTVSALIPWRPEADPTCPGGTAWRDVSGTCNNGLAFNVVFDFSNQNVILPNDIVFGLAFNTADYGNNPIHSAGPYNSLNYALTGAAPTVGTDINPDSLFVNTSWAGLRTPGVGTNGVFGADTNWTGYVPMASFDATAVPEPATTAIFGLGMIGLMLARRRKNA